MYISQGRYNYILCSLFVQPFSSFVFFFRNLNSFIIISLFMLASTRTSLKLFLRIPCIIEGFPVLLLSYFKFIIHVHNYFSPLFIHL